MTDAQPANDDAPETEGTIQFAYGLAPAAEPLTLEACADLVGWRSVLFDLGLIGQSAGRYGGFAYGNLSQRTAERGFLVTASQTSGATTLLAEDLVEVTDVNFERFWVEAHGTSPPSSEALTHAMLYAADTRIDYVFHIHSPEIWQARDALGLPVTPAEVAYGSPAMVAAVQTLLDENLSRPIVFATAGHEDGVFAAGHHARDCGGLLVAYLARARSLSL